MDRRTFVQVLASAFAAAPASAAAQQPKVYRIGILTSGTAAAERRRFDELAQGLDELGYVEGRNIEIQRRYADGKFEDLPALAADLVHRKVDVIVGMSTLATQAASRATRTIPIVFATVADPVAEGFARSLARPGGNVTGTSLALGDGFAGKWVELLEQVVPELSTCAVLWSSSNVAAARFVNEVDTAARALNVRIVARQAANLVELDAALGAIGSSGARGLIVVPSPFAATQQEKLVRFAADKRLPTMYFVEDFVDAGGLMSYGPSVADAYRRAATYVDRILKGAKPGDLPVEQPTRFELTINLNAARALGLKIPPSLLLRADRVIG